MAKPKKQSVGDVLIEKICEPKTMARMDVDQDYIKELSESISEVGLLQPILLAIDGSGFEIVAGHCRFLAHKLLGLVKIKAIAKEMTNEEIGVARATENIQRQDLTPIEEAATYKDLIETHGMSIEKVSKKIGRTPGTIKRRMDLLRMPAILQKAVHKKRISMTVAEELWPIASLTDLEYYLSFAIDNGCTKEVARQWAKDWKDSKRREGGASGQGTFIETSPQEPRPTYYPCDLCIQPVILDDSKMLRVCKGCAKIIQKGMEVKE